MATKTKRSKQERLPGMEQPHNKKIEKAADAYRYARDLRMEAAERKRKSGKSF